MKRIVLGLAFLISLQLSAQRSIDFVSPDRLLNEAKLYYHDENYSGCIDKVIQYKEFNANAKQLENADFLLLASHFYLNSRDVSSELKNYLDTYPSSHHRNEVYFMIGSSHFFHDEYRQAIYWLNQPDTDFLSDKQKEDNDYRLAVSYLQTKQYEPAGRLFNTLKGSSRYRDGVNYYTGYIYYIQKDYQNALTLFSPLRNRPEFQPEILYYLNQINFVQGRYSQTINEGKNLLRAYPANANNPETERIIGISYYYEGNYSEAIQYLKPYLAKIESPLNQDLYVIGLSHYYLGDYPEAIFYMNRSNPGDDELGQSMYLFLGHSYLKINDISKALMSFESASRLDFNPITKETATYNYAMLLHQTSTSSFGESVTVLENFLNTYPNSTYADNVNDALVEVYLTTNNYETALASINKIRKPNNKILTAKQKIYYYLGTVEFANGQFDKAINNFSEAINLGNYAVSERNLSYYWRGESYYRIGNYADAIKDYRSYIQTGDRSGNWQALANYNIGYSFFKQERFSEAQAAFADYIRTGGDNPNTLADAYARMGDCYFYKRNFAEAERAYAQSVAILPSMGDYALFQAGYVLGLQKNYQAKVGKMDQLIREYPQSPYLPDAMFEKARTYVLMNNNAAAIDSYKRVMTQFSNTTMACKAGLQLGLLYYNADNTQEAIEAYKSVVSNCQGSEETKVALQDLRSIYMELNDVNTYVSYVNSLNTNIQIDVNEQDSLTFMAAERTFKSGDYQKAIDGMRNYLQSYANGAFSTHAHYYLGSAYYYQDNYASAKQELGRVLETGDTQFAEQTLSYLANIAYAEKEYRGALDYYKRFESIASSRHNKDMALVGIVRSSFEIKEYNTTTSAANDLLAGSGLDPEIANEIRFLRAKALMDTGQREQAIKDYEELSKDTRTIYGAEAKYLLSVYYFSAGQNKTAKDIISDYFKVGTPHQYWLAKSYILIADILASEGDKLQAKQYLVSLKNNYPDSNDDIHYTIQDRLNVLEKE